MRFGEGFVEEIKDNGLAKVRVSRDSLYVACSVCAAADHVKLLAYNSIGAAEGDHVRYEVDDSHLISGAFVLLHPARSHAPRRSALRLSPRRPQRRSYRRRHRRTHRLGPGRAEV